MKKKVENNNGECAFHVTAIAGLGDWSWSFTILEYAKSIDDLIMKLQHCNGIVNDDDGNEWDVTGAKILKIELVT